MNITWLLFDLVIVTDSTFLTKLFFFISVCCYPFNSDADGTIHLAVSEAARADCYVWCQEKK